MLLKPLKSHLYLQISRVIWGVVLNPRIIKAVSYSWTLYFLGMLHLRMKLFYNRIMVLEICSLNCKSVSSAPDMKMRGWISYCINSFVKPLLRWYSNDFKSFHSFWDLKLCEEELFYTSGIGNWGLLTHLRTLLDFTRSWLSIFPWNIFLDSLQIPLHNFQ